LPLNITVTLTTAYVINSEILSLKGTPETKALAGRNNQKSELGQHIFFFKVL
jgi:hypothetical protein